MKVAFIFAKQSMFLDIFERDVVAISITNESFATIFCDGFSGDLKDWSISNHITGFYQCDISDKLAAIMLSWLVNNKNTGSWFSHIAFFMKKFLNVDFKKQGDLIGLNDIYTAARWIAKG